MISATRALAILSCAVGAMPAFAAPVANDSFASCQKRANGVESELKVCAAAEIERRDATLNGLYQSLIGKVGAPRQPALRAAERAWVSFRDAECAFQMSAEAGGSNASLLASTCRLELTARRTEDLCRALKVASF